MMHGPVTVIERIGIGIGCEGRSRLSMRVRALAPNRIGVWPMAVNRLLNWS